nr:uncharacterized protein LOC120969860 [Aegilops tauschii subsp. strangulata]
MSDQSDSQNKSEEQVNLSEGTSPSDSYGDGSRSTPSNLPKATTRQRRKRNSDSEDKDYVAIEEEVRSKKKVLKKEYVVAAATKPGLQKKAPARRVPTSKPRKVATGETMQFTIEQLNDDVAAGKKKKRARTTTSKVLGTSTMVRDSDDKEEEEEDATPTQMQTAVEQLQEEAEERKGKATTDAFQRVPRHRDLQQCM